MGQKVSPVSLRMSLRKAWKSKWFSKKDFAAFLNEDIKLRDTIKKKWARKGIADVIIERNANIVSVAVYTSKPGLIIGRGGAGIEEMRKELERKFNKKININVEEVQNPDLYAALVAENIGSALERRISFRRVLKQALERVKQAGAKGAKIAVSGRLNGVEMARREWVSFGKIPLQTLRADIDYISQAAQTTYGVIGIKVWIYKGEVFEEGKNTRK